MQKCSFVEFFVISTLFETLVDIILERLVIDSTY